MKYTIHKKERLFQEYFAVDRYHVQHTLFEGGQSPVFTREVFERGHGCVILPYDPKRDTVLMIEQFRAGALAADLHPWILEIPAGIIENGEKIEDVARRECFEEIGQEPKNLHYIGRFLVSPGGASETITLFCGTVDGSKTGGIYGLKEENEDIRVIAYTFAEIEELIAKQAINNASTMIALQWLMLNRVNLRKGL